MKSIHNTVYPELASVFQRFVADVKSALGDNFLGAYLVGSLATGDFDFDSDVDFLILTNAELSDAELNLLRVIHVAIHALGCYPAEHLEGSYLSTNLLNRADLVGVEPLWYVDNGSSVLQRSIHDNRWHVRWILRERGITIMGPDPKTLLPQIPAGALRTEAVKGLQEIKSLLLTEIDDPSGWFNMRFGQSFAVLTACRMLHTCQTGTVQSKFAAVKWAGQSLAPRWQELIRKAWTERIGTRSGDKVRQPAETSLVQETARFLSYAYHLAETAHGSVPVTFLLE
jgi:hypothetical protein